MNLTLKQIDFFLGDGSFSSANTIEVDGTTLHFKKSLIATGARAARIPIPGLTLAITHGIGLDKIASTIHPSPTQAEAIKKVGDAYSRTKLTPFVSKLFKKWLSWMRR